MRIILDDIFYLLINSWRTYKYDNLALRIELGDFAFGVDSESEQHSVKAQFTMYSSHNLVVETNNWN